MTQGTLPEGSTPQYTSLTEPTKPQPIATKPRPISPFGKKYLYVGQSGAKDKIDFYMSPPKKINQLLADKIKEVDRKETLSKVK
jgi:hypothetical protein